MNGHLCDEFCVCPQHRTPMIYWPQGDDHACQDVACEYGQGTWRALAGQERRRAERIAKAYNTLADEVVAGLSTPEHHKVMRGGLPFCECWHSLGSGDAGGDFITHALGLLREPQGTSPWIPADPDGLPPESYPQWRAQEQARREERS